MSTSSDVAKEIIDTSTFQSRSLLLDLNKQKELPTFYITSHYNTVETKIGCIHIFITERPPYCDRGRWLLHVDSNNNSLFCIDDADRFPRYYFNSDCLIKELVSFYTFRKEDIESMLEHFKITKGD